MSEHATTGVGDRVVTYSSGDGKITEPYIVEMPNPAVARAKRMRNITIGTRLVIILVVIGTWQIVSTFSSPITVSSPTAVYHAIITYADGNLLRDLWATMQEVILGYVIGAVLGILCGVLFASIPVIAGIVEPFILGVYGVPKIAFAPVLVVWLGINLTPKVTLAAMMAFFVVFFSSYDGIRNVDRGRLNAVRLMGASRFQLRRYVVFPGAKSNIFLGLKLGVPEALAGAIVGEFISSSKGVGYQIQFETASLNTAGVFAALLVLTALSIALNTIVKASSGKMDTDPSQRSLL
jgi:NitT/TauT family transport system permease protein